MLILIFYERLVGLISKEESVNGLVSSRHAKSKFKGKLPRELGTFSQANQGMQIALGLQFMVGVRGTIMESLEGDFE